MSTYQPSYRTSLTGADLEALMAALSQENLGLESYYPEWIYQQELYGQLWRHFTSASLHVEDDNGRLLYPLRINYFSFLANLHADLMWGYAGGDEDNAIRLLTRPRLLSRAPANWSERAAFLNEITEAVYTDNSASLLFREASVLYHVFGGHVFRVGFEDIRVTIDSIAANYFFPVWHPRRYSELLAVVVAYRISKEQAKMTYGVETKADYANYSELWTQESYTIRVDETIIARGPNPFVHPVTGKGVIPFVYIPRLRAGSFWGRSLISNIIGLVQELNARAADAGDAIDDISHRKIWARNLRGQQVPNLGEVPNGEIINLGDAVPGMEQAQPEIGVLEGAELPNDAMNILEFLQDLIREQSYTARVVLGIDEGSQRSALTLALRALPTVAIINAYRTAWNYGFMTLNNLIRLVLYHIPGPFDLRTGQFKSAYDILPDDFNYVTTFQWLPILPRDREALVQEVVALHGMGLRSRRLALEKLGDVPNIEEELRELEKLQEEQATRQTVKPFAKAQGNNLGTLD